MPVLPATNLIHGEMAGLMDLHGPRSEQAVVVFDGACSVCRALKEAVERRDRHHRLVFVAYQEADLGRLSPGLDRAMAARSVYLVRPDGRRFRGARAVFEALKRLPGLWGLAGTVWAWPPLSLLAEPFYRLVARNRGRISRWLGL